MTEIVCNFTAAKNSLLLVVIFSLHFIVSQSLSRMQRQNYNFTRTLISLNLSSLGSILTKCNYTVEHMHYKLVSHYRIRPSTLQPMIVNISSQSNFENGVCRPQKFSIPNSLSHTHTHTHTRVYNQHISCSLSLTLTHFHTHTHTHARGDGSGIGTNWPRLYGDRRIFFSHFILMTCALCHQQEEQDRNVTLKVVTKEIRSILYLSLLKYS